MNTNAQRIKTAASFAACGVALLLAAAAEAAGPATRPVAKAPAAAKAPLPPQTVTSRVSGLFEPAREADLRAVLTKIPGVELTAFDFEHAAGTFTIDPAKAFPGTKPEKYAERLDQVLRQTTSGLFSLRPPTGTPPEKLKRVEVFVAPLDCKACSLAVHEIVMKVDGVEQAAVDMKTGRVSALADPERVDPTKLEAALKAREVTVLPRP
ncbi:MAG TPA: heavy metal-associated domain-containing protein [Humisphaera sp.]